MLVGIFRLHPTKLQSGDRGHRLEGLRGAHRDQVDDVAAVGHSGQECVFGAEAEPLLQLFGERDDEFDIIRPHALLGRVAHVPARLAFRILYSLRVADGKPVPVGDIHHRFLAILGRAAVAVQDDHKRGSCLESFRAVEVIFPFKSLVLHRVAFAPLLDRIFFGRAFAGSY